MTVKLHPVASSAILFDDVLVLVLFPEPQVMEQDDHSVQTAVEQGPVDNAKIRHRTTSTFTLNFYKNVNFKEVELKVISLRKKRTDLQFLS